MTESGKLWSVVCEMEGDLSDIERWGLVLSSMGTSDDLEPGAAFVVGGALIDLGRRLRSRHEALVTAAREADAKLCA